MKKVILVDGNNLLFRSYYATAYSSTIMRNSKGFPTNALYGFVSMINKIIVEEKPQYMAVAFDIGKNFRKEKYAAYKEGRQQTPPDLIKQMQPARDILKYMGIKYFELEPYEADDIIGTLAKMADLDKDFDATIVSSDRDLLQLLSDVVDIKLLKQKDYVRYNAKTFEEHYHIMPINVVDLKALAGDSSDNIPGVKGIGEKTALKLLEEYETIENIYENIDNIKGKLKDKLINDKDNAFLSKNLATIYKDVPLDIESLEQIKVQEKDEEKLNELFLELEFSSFIKKFSLNQKKEPNLKFKIIEDISEIKLENIVSFYIELDDENYHTANILGMSLSDNKNNYFIKPNKILETFKLLKDKILYTYDLKKSYVLLNKNNYQIDNCVYDAYIATCLLYDNLKDDIASIMNNNAIDVPYFAEVKKNLANESFIINECVLKSRYILDSHDEIINKLKVEQMDKLFLNIEMPLIITLAKMEINGVKVDKELLLKLKEETQNQIDEIQNQIYSLAEEEFNIASVKQLGNILFEKLGLPYGKTSSSGVYKTDVKVLNKLIDKHPIVPKIIKFRNLNKRMTGYIAGLPNFIMDDGKIHTIYTQSYARTGRLSSMMPNLQNIPTRQEEGKLIRKAFYPENDVFLSVDYSQMELRILAHISSSEELQQAFINHEDIHTMVASDIYSVDIKDVTKQMRSTAKAVVFGIIYGISGFGLSENLSNISPKEANIYIEKFLEKYPGVKKYMNDIVNEASQEGSVRTLFNRKRNIPEINSKNYQIRSTGQRMAMNTPIQGTCADIIKKAMVDIDKEFTKKNLASKMILQVHDELIFDIFLNEKEQIEKIVKDKMENAIKLSVPLEVNIDYGKNWYDTK